jgi:hypothetical protein
MTAAAVALIVVCFYAFFYRAVVARWGRVVQWALRPLRLDTLHPVRHVEAVGKLAAAAVAQLLFAVALAWILGLRPENVVGFHPGLILAAAALGVGELALTSLLCTMVVEFTTAARGPTRDIARQEWTAQSRGGWMSYFLLTVRAASPAVALGSICLYVGVEELIFRGVLIPEFLEAGWGRGLAVAASAALFVGVQALAMPSVRAALFPMVGAAIVGVVHGILFLHVPDVIPLAIAHATFFLAAMLLARPQAVGVRAG